MTWLTQVASDITKASILHIKVLDQRNLRRSEVGEKGFLGALSLRIAQLIELRTGEDGMLHSDTLLYYRRLMHKIQK